MRVTCKLRSRARERVPLVYWRVKCIIVFASNAQTAEIEDYLLNNWESLLYGWGQRPKKMPAIAP